jgi:hypothetical protein
MVNLGWGKASFVFLYDPEEAKYLAESVGYYTQRWPSPKAMKRVRKRVHELTDLRHGEVVKRVDTPHSIFRATVEAPATADLTVHLSGGNLDAAAIGRNKDTDLQSARRAATTRHDSASGELVHHDRARLI